MRIINIPDISPHDDDFTNLQIGRPAEWVRLSGLPANALEKRIKRIRLSRYRGAMQAANAAAPSDLVISHLPAMTVATSLALGVMRKPVKHLAFSFNFTQRPLGLRRKIFQRAFASVDRFVVFSQYEAKFYAEYFDIEPTKISTLLWAQDCPQIGVGLPDVIQPPYFCAIGGEGRDIQLVIKAAESLTNKASFVIITRPHLTVDLRVPDNLVMLTDIPLIETWTIANKSLGVLVPLIADDTCCGHITIVSAKMLGIPIVTTNSVATTEYVSGRKGILSGQAGDLEQFVKNIENLLNNQQSIRTASRKAMPVETELHSRKNWEEFLTKYLGSL